MPAVGDVEKFRFSGTGDMATVADTVPTPHVTRDYPFVLTALIGWATGGTGSATLELKQKILDEPSGWFDDVRRKFSEFGTDGDAFIDWRIMEHEHYHWVLSAGDLWVPEWTNPDSGTMRWALEYQIRRWEP